MPGLRLVQSALEVKAQLRGVHPAIMKLLLQLLVPSAQLLCQNVESKRAGKEQMQANCSSSVWSHAKKAASEMDALPLGCDGATHVLVLCAGQELSNKECPTVSLISSWAPRRGSSSSKGCGSDPH